MHAGCLPMLLPTVISGVIVVQSAWRILLSIVRVLLGSATSFVSTTTQVCFLILLLLIIALDVLFRLLGNHSRWDQWHPLLSTEKRPLSVHVRQVPSLTKLELVGCKGSPRWNLRIGAPIRRAAASHQLSSHIVPTSWSVQITSVIISLGIGVFGDVVCILPVK